MFVCLAQCLFFVFQKPYVKYLNRLDYEKGIICSSTCYGLGSSVAFAGNMVSDVEIVVMVNDYKPIEVKDLPQAVQDTIKKDFADLTIKEAAVEESEEGTKTYKVTFTDAEGTDSEVFFNEKGEVLK